MYLTGLAYLYLGTGFGETKSFERINEDDGTG